MQFSGRLVIIIALSITTLLASNIIAIKPVSLFTLPFQIFGDNLFVVSAAIICFPISYIVSDVLTEVYGFRVARGVIWLGFVCNLMMVILFWLGGLIPGAVFWEDQGAYMTILGATGWILLGSFIAYIVGEFTNAAVMVVLKNKTEGRHLWDTDDFVDGGRTGRGLGAVLQHRVRHIGTVAVACGVRGYDIRVGGKVDLRGAGDATDLSCRELAEAHGADGHL